MMNPIETGKLIAELRKEAGYTQKALAEALCVTDKAVSKWERGICFPDSSLLTKLSMLLDADIEFIFNGTKLYGKHHWTGEIRAEEIEGEIAGKPLVHYLLSYFMLVGITDVCIRTDKTEYIRGLHLEQYGLNIRFCPLAEEKTVLIHDKFLVFGANLTRYFQSYINDNKNIIPVSDGRELPMIFTHHPSFSLAWHKENCEKRQLARGTVYLPLNKDAADFIRIYERNSGRKIADLAEIAKHRGLI